MGFDAGLTQMTCSTDRHSGKSRLARRLLTEDCGLWLWIDADDMVERSAFWRVAAGTLILMTNCLIDLRIMLSVLSGNGWDNSSTVYSWSDFVQILFVKMPFLAPNRSELLTLTNLWTLSIPRSIIKLDLQRSETLSLKYFKRSQHFRTRRQLRSLWN